MAQTQDQAYVATLSDARTWRDETDKFVFVQDLLDVSLLEDGDEYVSRRVERLERQFERLLYGEMRIVNIYELFQNPTGDARWQLWDGDDLIGVYQTRAAAREARLRRISTGAA